MKGVQYGRRYLVLDLTESAARFMAKEILPFFSAKDRIPLRQAIKHFDMEEKHMIKEKEERNVLV